MADSYWDLDEKERATLTREQVEGSRSMSIQKLRGELPEWTWRAVRAGMGWRYEGHRGGSRVTVQAEGVLCGPSDDDVTVRWMVYETGESYATWYCREITRLKVEWVRDA